MEPSEDVCLYPALRSMARLNILIRLPLANLVNVISKKLAS